MAARDSVSELATKDLVIERVFDAPRERVFDVFTTAGASSEVVGSEDGRHPVTEFEARPGGKIFFGERNSDGAMLYIAGVVREIERPSRLVFAIHFANEKRERVSPPARLEPTRDSWTGRWSERDVARRGTTHPRHRDCAPSGRAFCGVGCGRPLWLGRVARQAWPCDR